MWCAAWTTSALICIQLHTIAKHVPEGSIPWWFNMDLSWLVKHPNVHLTRSQWLIVIVSNSFPLGRGYCHAIIYNETWACALAACFNHFPRGTRTSWHSLTSVHSVVACLCRLSSRGQKEAKCANWKSTLALRMLCFKIFRDNLRRL